MNLKPSKCPLCQSEDFYPVFNTWVCGWCHPDPSRPDIDAYLASLQDPTDYRTRIENTASIDR